MDSVSESGSSSTLVDEAGAVEEGEVEEEEEVEDDEADDESLLSVVYTTAFQTLRQ